ncbi:MAG TPA: MetQ/NlpA family ABC transporter substrate-binding protein [Alloiococcus sp.]|nr:MetQ/NlpA family ABC transporter substrate-binding protein [Alloiococcus sp.]
MSLFKKLGLLSTSALLLAACGNEDTDHSADTAETTEESNEETSNQEDFHFEIASHTTPMVDIVELVTEELEAQDGYTADLLTVNDNIQYNEAVLNDEAFASFAQHEPFMELFNEERDGDLVAIQPVYNAIVGYYAPEYESLDDIEDGAEVVIASDIANMARSLFILEQHGIITLDGEEETFPTLDNIEENPHNLEFVEMEVSNTAQGYLDGYDMVFAYPTFIEQVADLTPEDALILEDDPDGKFAITVVVREENADTPEAEALKEAFTSDKVVDFLDELSESGHLERAF